MESTRYAVLLGDMVIGDGETREAALVDAESAPGPQDDAVVVAYDAERYEVRYSRGLVCLVRRDRCGWCGKRAADGCCEATGGARPRGSDGVLL